MHEQNIETIKMVSNALTVLDVLRTSKNSLGVNEISKRCGINPSTTYRILKTLELEGWAFQCSDDRYIAGEKISFVTEKDNLFLALKEVALPVMEKYTAAHGRAMSLTVRDGIICTVILRSRTKSLIDYAPAVGTKLPFYACAGGKILLSEIPTPLLEQWLDIFVLERLTSNTIVSTERFQSELQAVAKQGFAFDDRESIENGSCVAVAIRDKTGTIIAALSFSGFVNVANISELQKYVPILHEAASEISDRLYRCFQR